MKNDLAKILLLVFLLIGCRSWGGRPEDKKYDPRDTLQKPLPDSILVRDTSIKSFNYDAQPYYDSTKEAIWTLPAQGDVWSASCDRMILSEDGAFRYSLNGKWIRSDQLEINEIRKRKGGTP